MFDLNHMKNMLILPLLGLAALSLGTAAQAQSDPFESDDDLPFLGSSMDGGRPDYTFPFNNFDGRAKGWRISGRNLDGNQDLDWMIFNDQDYVQCEFEGRINIVAVGDDAEENLQVEVLGYRKSFVFDSSVIPIVLQSCSNAPRGSSTIELINDSDISREDFRDFYRLRNCRNGANLQYRFEYEITEEVRCIQLLDFAGTVRDIRDNRPIKGAYVFSNQNDVTFSSPADGEFEMALTPTNNAVLDFFAAGYESETPLVLGRVEENDQILDIELFGQPPGMIFFSGFE